MSTDRALPPESTVDAPVALAPRRTRTAALVALAVAAVVGAAFGVVRYRAHARPATAEAKPDVPRLEGGAIVFSGGFARRSGIKLATVGETSLSPVVQAVGTVTFDSGHTAAAGTRIRGFVTKVLKVEGDHVAKGEALAEIESTELGNAQAEVSVVMAKKNAAERNAKRETDLLANKLTTAREEELARAELEEQKAMLLAAMHHVTALGGSSAGKIGTYLVRAPIGGTVVSRTISAGQSVDSDLVAFRVADLDHLWIELSVFEREIGGIKVDDLVELSPTGADASVAQKGKVAYVGELIDPDSRTAMVRVVVDNRLRLLRPGQSVVARVRPAKLSHVAITVPVSAVTFVDGKPMVFVASSETSVVAKEVVLGRSDGVSQEIVKGLTVGQRIVSEGTFALKSELYR